MKANIFTKGMFSTLLLVGTSNLVLAAPNYPEDFTPQIIYQDKEYIAEHSQSEQPQTAASAGPCSCPCGSSQPEEKVPGDFEPVILYQDKEYISNH